MPRSIQRQLGHERAIAKAAIAAQARADREARKVQAAARKEQNEADLVARKERGLARTTQAAKTRKLRAAQVHDTRANFLSSLAQGGRRDGGALVSAYTANENLKAIKAKRDAAVGQAQAIIDAANHEFNEEKGRYLPIDGSIVWNDESGEFEPFDLPMTYTEYLRRLGIEWGPTWSTGPSWRLGGESTIFRCAVVSCIENADVGEGYHHVHTSEPRDSRVRSYSWTNRFLFSSSNGALVWYLDEAGDRHYKDGRLLDRDSMPNVSGFEPVIQAEMLKRHMMEVYGADVAHAADPFRLTNLGRVNYRLETLGSNDRADVTLEFKTAFLREHMQFGGLFGAVAPFLPGLGQWAFLQDSKLPIASESVLQLVRDYYNWQTPTEAFVGEVDRAYLADRLEKFADHASDSPADVEFRRDSYCLARFHEECPELTHIDSSASFALLIEHVVPHDSGPAAPIAPIDTQLGDFIVPQILANKHVRVRANPNAASLIDWFLKPETTLPSEFDLVPCCVFRDFVDTWAKPINEAWLKSNHKTGGISVPNELMLNGRPSITIESLQSYLMLTPNEYRLPIPMQKKLLTRFGIGAKWYGEGWQLIDKLEATTHKIAPECALYYVKNGHLYHLTESLLSIFKRDDEAKEELLMPSAHYKLVDPKTKPLRVFCQTADEIVTFDRSKFDKGARFDFRLNESLAPLLKTLRTTCSLDPDVMFSGAETMAPTRISFNVDDHAITITNPLSAGWLQPGMSQFVPDAAYLDRLESLKGDFFHSVARPTNLSHFGPEFLSWIAADNRGPLTGRTLCSPFPLFDEDGNMTKLGATTEVDIRGAYPHELRSMEFLPVCIDSDVPQAYDGHQCEEWTIYDVERTCRYVELPGEWARTMLSEVRNRIVGRDLMKFQDEGIENYIKIVSFFRPYRLMKNPSPQYIDAIIRDPVLQQAHKKTECLLKPIGMLGKKNNTRQEVRLFSTEGEAEYLKREMHGSVNKYPHTFRPDPSNPANSLSDDWYVYKSPERSTKLQTGFWLIHFYILSAARAATARSCVILEEEGKSIVALNTDAVYILGTFTTAPLDKSDPVNLGKRSYTPKAAPDKIMRFLDRNLVWTPPDQVPIVNISLHNEGSCHEVVELSKTTNLLLVGDCAGAGKSSMSIKTVNKMHEILKPMLFVVPNNHQRKERLREGLDHVDTHAHILGQRFTDDGESVCVGGEYKYRGDKSKPLSYFKSIVFDETLSLDSTSRGLLDRFVAKIRGLDNPPRLFATGDSSQLVIEHDLNPTIDLQKYLDDWSRRLFPTAVVLHEPKRFPLALDKKLVLGLKDAIATDRRAVISSFKSIDLEGLLNLPSDTRVISYTNATRNKINEAVHYSRHTLPYELEGSLVYCGRSKKQGEHTLYTNYTYIIKAVSNTMVSLVEEGEEEVKFDLLRKSVDDWFTYPHASTVHSAQGSTYKGAVVIADVWHPRADNAWLYVALTRATHPRANVYILRGRTPPPVDLGAIKAQIQRLLIDDTKKMSNRRRRGAPVSLDWYLECDKKQDGKCALCHHEYELPRVGIKAGGETASIDRIVSEKRGHDEGNCQLVCRSCNYSKKDKLV